MLLQYDARVALCLGRSFRQQCYTNKTEQRHDAAGQGADHPRFLILEDLANDKIRWGIVVWNSCFHDVLPVIPSSGWGVLKSPLPKIVVKFVFGVPELNRCVVSQVGQVAAVTQPPTGRDQQQRRKGPREDGTETVGLKPRRLRRDGCFVGNQREHPQLLRAGYLDGFAATWARHRGARLGDSDRNNSPTIAG